MRINLLITSLSVLFSAAGQKYNLGVTCLSKNHCVGLALLDLFGIFQYPDRLSCSIEMSVVVLPSVLLRITSSTSIVVAVRSRYSSPSVTVVAELVTVHWFNPRFAQSANSRLRDRLAVTPSYPVRNSRPHRSNASSMYSATSGSKSLDPDVAIYQFL